MKIPRRVWWLVAAGVVVVASVAVTAPATVGVLRARGTTLHTPDSAAGLTREQSSEVALTLAATIQSDVGLPHTVGAAYSGSSRVLVAGGTGSVWRPSRTLDQVLAVVDPDLSQVREVEPGRHGGVAKCGRSSVDGGELVVCGWADHGCAAVVMVEGGDLDYASRTLRELRAAMQKR